jgi:hypothetical protein
MGTKGPTTDKITSTKTLKLTNTYTVDSSVRTQQQICTVSIQLLQYLHSQRWLYNSLSLLNIIAPLVLVLPLIWNEKYTILLSTEN